MTKEQAIEIIDNALAQMALSRKDHMTLIQALNVLKGDKDASSHNN